MPETDTRAPTLPGQEFDITVLSDSLWRVRVPFPTAEVSDREMLARLREVKQRIAALYTVPVELLEFREVVNRERTGRGLFATVTIGRLAAGRGRTVLKLKPLISPAGERYEDMVAELDFYYLNEFDQRVDLDRLQSQFQKEKLAEELIDYPTVLSALQRVEERRSYVQKLEVARGRFPEKGVDAILEYTFHTDPTQALDLTEYRTSRKVREGDLLCQKIPPRDGQRGGLNVRGEAIPPLKGLDFEMVAGEGTRLSLDGHRITAARDGLAVMTRFMRRIYTLAGKKVVPSRIEVTVQEVLSIRADKAVNLAADGPVEITGTLKEGSTITSRGEIFLTGDVESGAKIHSGSDVLVGGQIQGAQIASDGAVMAEKGAKDATITAREAVAVKGTAENSDISAREVMVLESLGSRIMASYKVNLKRAGNDAAGRRTTVRVGRSDFYTSQILANQEAIKNLSSSLERLKQFFGRDTLARVKEENLQRLLLQQLQFLRNQRRKLTPEQAQDLKKLLEAVRPLISNLTERQGEFQILLKKINEEDPEKPLVVIRETIRDSIEVSIDEASGTVAPTDRGVMITPGVNGQLQTAPLEEGKPDKEKD